jgi:acyl-CoA synthetase (AMP-forming)/AMP-acid ligase II
MATFPQAEFVQVYGMTECMSCTILAGEDHRQGARRRSAGRAAALTEVRVVDSDDQDVPPGTDGEILLRGASQMLCYWNDPAATAKTLRGGWTHTGDIGYLDEAGYVYVVDRLKDMIIVDGDNVHSPEVENALSSHPDVAACAVIGVPDGETGERVHAVVVLQPGATPDPDQLRKHCASRVADFKVPSGWEFVDVLPTSPTGKVLKRELRTPHWAGRQREVN